MNKRTRILVGLLMIITLSSVRPNTASARFHVGKVLHGPIGIRASTQSGVGVILPTPAVSAGTRDVSVTASPTGVQANYSNPQGVRAEVDSDGNYFGADQQVLPGNVKASEGIHNGEVNADAEVEVQ